MQRGLIARIFIASPSDVMEERNEACNVNMVYHDSKRQAVDPEASSQFLESILNPSPPMLKGFAGEGV